MAEADFESDFELQEEPNHTEPQLYELEYADKELSEQEAARARQAAVQPANIGQLLVTLPVQVDQCNSRRPREQQFIHTTLQVKTGGVMLNLK